MKKIKLSVLGLSYSQTQSGAYALILADESSNQRIPIIIGSAEAQAIAIELENLKPPRPLTHDLFVDFATSFGISLVEVNISKLEEGVFFSDLLFDNGYEKIKIDARTSDAIALALKFKCPIFTSPEILAKTGIILFDKETEQSETSTSEPEPLSEFDGLNEEQLTELLQKYIANEEYEKASEIRDEINRRKNSTSEN